MKKYHWLIAGIVSAFVFLGILSFFAVPAPKPGEFAWLHMVVFLATVLGMLAIISLSVFLSSEKMAGENDVILSKFSLYPLDTETIINNEKLDPAILTTKEAFYQHHLINMKNPLSISIEKKFVSKILVNYDPKTKTVTIMSLARIDFFFHIKNKDGFESYHYNPSSNK